MTTFYLITGIIIYILLGLHSCYFLIKRMTIHCDFIICDTWMLICCFLLPIITHIATLITFPNLDTNNNCNKILFPKK